MACRRKCTLKFFLLMCFILIIIMMFLSHVVWKKSTSILLANESKDSWFTNRQSFTGTPNTMGTPSSTGTTHNIGTSITLFVRMAGKLEEHRKRYYCYLFRTTVLYWPPSFGKTVLVLDEESEQDHVFAEKVTRQNNKHFPEHKLEVLYESLPKDQSTLDFAGMPRSPGYNRQLWSSFFIDLYTNDSIVAWMDNDAAFITPVTKSMIFSGTKLRVLGSECSMGDSWVQTWARTAELALGLPMVADFMTYFPVYIYRDTFTGCREHILRHLNTSNFDEAFRKFYLGMLSPVSIVLSYAWYFERDRYDWNMKICTDLTEYNKRFPKGHTIGSEHIENILSEPQATYHVPYGEFLSSHVLVSFCLAHKAAGNELDMCTNHSVSLSNNFVLLNHDLQRVKSLGENTFVEQSLCTGSNTNFCLQGLERHYNQAGLEIKQNVRKLEWHNIETVEKLANDVDIKCDPIKLELSSGAA